jgi:hypothetical protein
MRSHERQLPSIESRRIERKTLGALRFFCQTVWQRASEDAQEEYPQYELSVDAYADLYVTHDTSIYSLVLNILQDLVQIYQYIERDDALHLEYPDEILRAASFGLCRLGSEASYGDVSYAIPFLDDERAGYQALKELFNEWLRRSVRKLKRLRRNEESRSTRHHAPAPWFIDAERGFQLDAAIIRTNYHLFSSLLVYLEGEEAKA